MVETSGTILAIVTYMVRVGLPISLVVHRFARRPSALTAQAR
jgi:hypothetical protein